MTLAVLIVLRTLSWISIWTLPASLTPMRSRQHHVLPPAGAQGPEAELRVSTRWSKEIGLPVVNQAAVPGQAQDQAWPEGTSSTTPLRRGGVAGKDTCKATAAPLVCPSKYDPSQRQAGIVARGIRCGENSVPGSVR